MALDDGALLDGLLRQLDREDQGFDPAQYKAKAQAILDQLLPMQRAMAEDWHKRICLLTPSKNGKTFTVRARLLRGALLKKAFYGLYIGLSRQKAKEDIWDGESGLRNLCELLGLKIGQFSDPDVDVVFNNQDLIAYFPKTGSLIRVGGADNMEAIEKYRGGPGYDEVWIDEAKSHTPTLLKELLDEVLEARVNWKDGVMGVCGTPGSDLRGYFYDLTRNGSELSISCTDENPEPLRWNCHRWSLEQNTIRLPGQTTSAWERALALKKAKGWTDRNTTWRREYLGQWCAELTSNVYKFQQHDDTTGEPWNIWKPLEKTPANPLGLFSQVKVGEQWQPIAWHFGIGMDLGENDLFALEVFAFSAQLPSRVYQVHEVVKRFREMDVPGQKPFSRVDFIGNALSKAIALIQAYDDYPMVVVADMAHMGEAILAEVLIRFGHVIKKANKADKDGLISLVNDDLVDGRMVLFDDERENVLAEQMTELQYDDSGKREMPGAPNDACDCTVYFRGEAIKFIGHTAPLPVEEKTADQIHADELLRKLSQRRPDDQFTTYSDFTNYDPRR